MRACIEDGVGEGRKARYRIYDEGPKSNFLPFGFNGGCHIKLRWNNVAIAFSDDSSKNLIGFNVG